MEDFKQWLDEAPLDELKEKLELIQNQIEVIEEIKSKFGK